MAEARKGARSVGMSLMSIGDSVGAEHIHPFDLEHDDEIRSLPCSPVAHLGGPLRMQPVRAPCTSAARADSLCLDAPFPLPFPTIHTNPLARPTTHACRFNNASHSLKARHRLRRAA